MPRLVRLALICAGLLAVALPASASAAFIGKSGTNLTNGTAPFRFIGFNNYQLTGRTGNAVCGRALSDTQVDQVLQQAKDAGATVVRTWFFQASYRAEGNSYAAYDRVLTKAAAKGLKVVPVLVNHYPDCEPSGGAKKDEGFYDYGYKQSGWGYPQSYKDWAYNLAAHYKTNQTVAFWQLVNEAETSYNGGCNTTIESNGRTRSSNILRRFVDDMGGAIHGADPNHLVSLGTIGSGQCGAANSTEYQYVHQSGGTDLCEYHDYDKATQPLPGDQYNGLQTRINDCNAVGKPFLVGESGIVADAGTDGGSTGSITSTTLQRRADFFSAKLNSAFSAGVDGYMLWEKILDGSSSSYNLNNGRYGIGPSDPLNAVTKAKAGSL